MDRLRHVRDYILKYPPEPTGRTDQGVYIFECQGMIKVGVTHDPLWRLKVSQTGNPFEIRLLGFRVVEYPFRVEKMLHRNLGAYHVRGEWFRVPPDVLNGLLTGKLGPDTSQPEGA